MTIASLLNKIFKANQTPNNTVNWSGVNGLKSIQEDLVDTIRQRTFFTVPTTADLLNQGFSNAILCYVQDNAFYRWQPNGIPNGTTIFPAIDGGVWVQETIGDTDGTVTSIGLSMPAAFTVANSPITTSGVIGVTAAGTSAEYIKGDGTLGTLPTSLISGSGTTNYVSKWSNTTTLTDGIIYDNGTYTGIGTTNPLARVHIKVPDNNPQRGLLCLETTSAGANPFQSFWSNNTWVGYIDVHQNYFNIQSVTNGLMNLNPSGGNVTVGSVTNAGYKFDVVGSFRATSTTTLSSLSGSGTRMVVADATGILSTQAVPTGTITGSGTTNYVSKWSSSSSLSNSVLYDDGTNVGIGTTSPAQKLDVNGLIRTNRTSNTDGGVVFGTVGTYLYGADSGGYLATYTSNTERMRVTNDGNVGIGTTNIGFVTPGRTIMSLNGANSTLIESQVGGVFQSYIFTSPSTFEFYSNSRMDFYTLGTARLVIAPSGNVLIGTLTDNGQKFQVNGGASVNSLAGSGTRMVVADSTGVLSTQAIPTIPTKSFGAWQTDATQTAAVNNTGYGVRFNTADISGQGIAIQADSLGNNTLIKMANAGYYNIQFSFQFQNVDNQLHDVSIWLRKNGQNTAADVAGSGGFLSVPNSHGGTPGHCIAAWNYFVQANANDYYQLVWSTTNATNVTMEFYPAGSPPPSAASAILTVNQVN
jgi:hypothetical protein